MGLTCRCPTLGLLKVGSSDPRPKPRNNLFRPRTVQPCNTAGRAKTAPRRHWQNRPAPSPNEGRLAKIQATPTSNTRARVLRPANPKKHPQKDNPKMTPRATTPISQANSHHRTRSRTAASRAACSTAQPSPIENPSRQRAKLIHGSAIKTSGKRPRISKLRNSNRR